MERIVLKYRGGGNFSKIKPKFSSCEDSIFIARQYKILQYATKTGLLISEFHVEAPIVEFNVYFHDSCENLLVCCKNGELIEWKTVTKFKMMSKKLPCECVTNFIHLPGETQNEAVISYNQKGVDCIGTVNISKGSLKRFQMKFNKFVKIVASPLGYVAVMEKRVVRLFSIDETKRNLIQIQKKLEKFTYITCHPNEETILTGDSEGQITLYQNIFSKNYASAKFHWHTLAINCLEFSNAGSYFYSGGNECVFVRWDQSGNKKFIPRMSGFIEEISAMNQLVAIFTSDNTVKIIDSGFNEISSIQSLVISGSYSGGIIFDPRTKSLVLNGTTGVLQFYNPNKTELVYTIDVVSQNKLTNERTCNIENTNVTKFNVSKSGLWLVTVEERNDPDRVHNELQMKFWKFDEVSQKFYLNTSIDKPHESSISNVLFQYTNDDEILKCITVGTDQKFKIWKKINIVQVNIERTVWNCFSVGFYRNLPCNALSCSYDGSLISIGFSAILTCWSVDNCELKCSLKYPKFNETIEHCEFGTNNLCHLIVTSTENRLSVWNILTLTMIWTVPLKINFLLSNKLSIYMTVVTKKNEIFVFSPNNPNPIYTNKDMLKNEIITAGLIPIQLVQDDQAKWYRRVEIFLLDSSKELYSIGVESCDFSDETKEEFNSIYQQILPMKKISNVSTDTREHLFSDNVKKNLEKYLLGPTHTMIPVRLTCGPLIKSFLVNKNSKTL